MESMTSISLFSRQNALHIFLQSVIFIQESVYRMLDELDTFSHSFVYGLSIIIADRFFFFFFALSALLFFHSHFVYV